MSDPLLETLQKKVKTLEMLSELSKYVNSSLTTSEIQRKVMESVTNVLNADVATLYIYDKGNNELIFDTVLGDAEDTLKRIRIEAKPTSLAGSCAFNRQSEIINDVKIDLRHAKKMEKKAKLHCFNMMVAPVIFRDNLIGVLQVINKKHGDFDQSDLSTLEGVTNIVAVALENAQLYENLRLQFNQMVESMAYAMEMRDKYTGGHTKRVVFFSISIAKELNFSFQDLQDLRLSAVLHDVGKIGVEDKILNKPSPLNKSEFEIMKAHPEIGYHIMKNINSMDKLIDGIRYHHERFDGKGYPKKLQGLEIPLFARVIAVGDAFDAMVSHRPYRRGLDPQVAFEEIANNAGTQFDPQVVEAFKRAYVEFNFVEYVRKVVGQSPGFPEALPKRKKAA